MGVLNTPSLNLQSNSGSGGALLTTLLSHFLNESSRKKQFEREQEAAVTSNDTTRTELEKWLTAQKPMEEATVPAGIARPTPEAMSTPPPVPQAPKMELENLMAKPTEQRQPPPVPSAPEQAPLLSKMFRGEQEIAPTPPTEAPFEQQTRQVMVPPKPVTLPARQSPSVYNAAALGGMQDRDMLKTNPQGLSLITNEQGEYQYLPKKEGLTGVHKQQDYVFKAEVQKDETGREQVYNLAYDKHNPSGQPVRMGLVRDPFQAAIVRAEAFAKAKPYPALDAYNNFTPTVVTWGDADRANQEARANGQPDRFVPVGPTTSALEKMALVADMQRTIDRVRETLPGAKFDAAAAAQASEMLRSINDKEAFGRMIQYATGKTLTPGQADYLIAIAQLQENSMALRSVLKAGPGSDQLREKILATLPSGSTPDIEYAKKQIDQYEGMLGALGKGVIGNVPSQTIRGISSATPLPLGAAAGAPTITAAPAAPVVPGAPPKQMIKTTPGSFKPAF